MQVWSHEPCIARMDDLARTVAVLRALVEELQQTIRERQLHIPTEGDIAADQLDRFGRSCDCPYCVVLALTEDDMRKRLEAK